MNSEDSFGAGPDLLGRVYAAAAAHPRDKRGKDRARSARENEVGGRPHGRADAAEQLLGARRIEVLAAAGAGKRRQRCGGLGIDATAPLGVQVYERARYPVDEMDFSKWFSEEELAELRGLQDPYFRWLGEKGYA